MNLTLKIGLLCFFIFVLAGCSGLRRAEVSYCGGTIPCGWIAPQGRDVSGDKDLGGAGTGYLDAGMKYYYSRCDTLPAAVIKLNKGYALDDVRWEQITDHETFLTLIRYIKTAGREKGGRELKGFTIKANNGQPIGLAYADKYIYGLFRLGMLANNKVHVHAPNVVTDNVFAKILPKAWGSDSAISQVIPPSPEIISKNQQESNKCQGCHHPYDGASI